MALILKDFTWLDKKKILNFFTRQDAIAIVGVGCRAPGADNIRDLWRVLRNGECHVTEVPPERWNTSAYYSEDPTAAGKAYVMRGGFMKE